MSLDLSELEEFGQAADQLQQPALVEGGFLVSDGGSAGVSSGRRENWNSHVRPGPRAEEARPAAGSRQGRSASSTASGQAAHPVERGLSEILGLEELFSWHSDARWVSNSSNPALLLVPLGLFKNLPYRADLLLEIPASWPTWLVGKQHQHVPFIRAWAFWSVGIAIRAHHEYPDRSICAYSAGDPLLGVSPDWALGSDSIEDYVGFCACWTAKALHMQLLGRWPGLQHYPAAARVMRAKPDEYCGCGRPNRYRECCMEADLALSAAERVQQRAQAERDYLRELGRRDLSPRPPRLPSTGK